MGHEIWPKTTKFCGSEFSTLAWKIQEILFEHHPKRCHGIFFCASQMYKFCVRFIHSVPWFIVIIFCHRRSPFPVRSFLGSRTRTGVYASGLISGTGLCHFHFRYGDTSLAIRQEQEGGDTSLLQSVYLDSFVTEHAPEPETKKNRQCTMVPEMGFLTGNGSAISRLVQSAIHPIVRPAQ